MDTTVEIINRHHRVAPLAIVYCDVLQTVVAGRGVNAMRRRRRLDHCSAHNSTNTMPIDAYLTFDWNSTLIRQAGMVVVCDLKRVSPCNRNNVLKLTTSFLLY